MASESEYVARALRLRRLMVGPSDSLAAMAGIQDIINERIAELTTQIDEYDNTARGTSGPEPEQ